MKKEELKSKLTLLQKEYEGKYRQIEIDFALANNPYKIGDIISDHSITIKIEEIKFNKGWGQELPNCKYIGIRLKKDGTPTKNQSENVIYQTNIISVNQP